MHPDVAKLIAALVVCSPVLLGVILPASFMKRHGFYLVSFAIACMMGAVFFELLPEVWHEAGNIINGTKHGQQPLTKPQAQGLSALLLGGMIFGWAMEWLVHFLSPHSHDHGGECDHGHAHGSDGHTHTHDHDDTECQHNTDEDASDIQDSKRRAGLCGLPTLVILDMVARLIHHICDGIVLGTAPASDIWAIAGALAAHEIGHAVGGVGLYISLGLGKWLAVTLITCIMLIPTYMGTALGILLKSKVPKIDAYVIPFAIGIILYVALVDLLPELAHFRATKHQKIISAGIAVITLGGIFALSYTLGHSHSHGDGHSHDHDSHGDGHSHDH